MVRRQGVTPRGSARRVAPIPGPPVAPTLSGHQQGGISYLRFTGQLPQAARAAREALLEAWSTAPGAVLAELVDLEGALDPRSVSELASVGARVREWPGTPIGVVCPRPDLREELTRTPDGDRLAVGGTRASVSRKLSRSEHALTLRWQLLPTLRSARQARDLVTRTCLDWGLRSSISSATLVTSELVTNALLHSGTDVELLVSRCGSLLRVAVHDGSQALPVDRQIGGASTTGRGTHVVSALSESWGAQPLGDGKLVWAVLRTPTRT